MKALGNVVMDKGSITSSGNDFYVIFCVLLLRFYFSVQYTLFVPIFRNSFSNMNSFSILNQRHIYNRPLS